MAAARGQTLAEMALAWLLSHEEITTVLIGASKTQQILDNIKAVQNTSLPPKNWRRSTGSANKRKAFPVGGKVAGLRPRPDEGGAAVVARERVAAVTPPSSVTFGDSFSLRAKSRLRRLRSDTRLRAQPPQGKPFCCRGRRPRRPAEGSSPPYKSLYKGAHK